MAQAIFRTDEEAQGISVSVPDESNVYVWQAPHPTRSLARIGSVW